MTREDKIAEIDSLEVTVKAVANEFDEREKQLYIDAVADHKKAVDDCDALKKDIEARYKADLAKLGADRQSMLASIAARKCTIIDSIELTEQDILELTNGDPKKGDQIQFYDKHYRVTGVSSDADGKKSVTWIPIPIVPNAVTTS